MSRDVSRDVSRDDVERQPPEVLEVQCRGKCDVLYQIRVQGHQNGSAGGNPLMGLGVFPTPPFPLFLSFAFVMSIGIRSFTAFRAVLRKARQT